MVDFNELNEQNIPIKQRSVIDYLYFGNQTTTGPGNDFCFVHGNPLMPDWFRLDQGHAEFYEIDALEKTTC
jgi:hypothetical protein